MSDIFHELSLSRPRCRSWFKVSLVQIDLIMTEVPGWDRDEAGHTFHLVIKGVPQFCQEPKSSW